MIRQTVDFDEDLFYKVAGRQNGLDFSGAAVQLIQLGLATLERDEEERARMARGGTQIDFDALRAVRA